MWILQCAFILQLHVWNLGIPGSINIIYLSLIAREVGGEG